MFLSCKNDNYEQAIKNSKNPDIDRVFYAVAKAEIDHNPSVEIIDKAKDEDVYWNQAIFPGTDFINSDTLSYYLQDQKKYAAFAKKHNNWIELSKPIFSENKTKAEIVVDLHGPNYSGAAYAYFLERKKNKFIIVKKRLISIS